MKKTLTILIVVFSLGFVASILIIDHAIAPYRDVRKQTIRHVQHYTDLQDPDQFYWYHGDQGSYATIGGLNSAGEYILAIVEEGTGHIDLFKGQEVISEHQLVQLASDQLEDAVLVDVRIAKEDDQALWVVLSKNTDGSINYHYYTLEDGQLVDSILNV